MTVGSVANFNTAAAWPSANLAIAVPFMQDVFDVPVSAAWENGTITTAPSVDVGIYDDNLNLLTHTGATTASGATALQSANLVSPPTLSPGNYYMAMSVSGTGSTFDSTATLVAPVLRACGLVQMASAEPLPSTLTAAVITNAYLPLFGITFSSAF